MAILEFPIRQSAPNYIVLKYICVSRFRVLPAQYQILSSCPSLLYVHGGPMGIFNIRSENFWVNQNEKCENILSIRSGSCAEELPISEGELQWKMGCNIQRRVILRNNFDVKVQSSDKLDSRDCGIKDVCVLELGCGSRQTSPTNILNPPSKLGEIRISRTSFDLFH